MRHVTHEQLAKEEASMAVTPIPEGYHTVTPYLVVQGVPKLIDFLKQAFDAQEIRRMPRPDGTIMHAEVRIGDSAVMMAEAMGGFKPMPGSRYLYVDDTDATYQRRSKRAPPQRWSQRTSSGGTATRA
jgi:PhnB protein